MIRLLTISTLLLASSSASGQGPAPPPSTLEVIVPGANSVNGSILKNGVTIFQDSNDDTGSNYRAASTRLNSSDNPAIVGVTQLTSHGKINGSTSRSVTVGGSVEQFSNIWVAQQTDPAQKSTGNATGTMGFKANVASPTVASVFFQGMLANGNHPNDDFYGHCYISATPKIPATPTTPEIPATPGLEIRLKTRTVNGVKKIQKKLGDGPWVDAFLGQIDKTVPIGNGATVTVFTNVDCVGGKGASCRINIALANAGEGQLGGGPGGGGGGPGGGGPG